MNETITAAAIELMERGWVPESWMRQGIRRLCRERLRQRSEDPQGLEEFVRAASQGPIAPVPEKANQQHYEVPEAFFGQVLGKHRKYSCCYWEPGETSLDKAEAAALLRTCDHAELADGLDILELGCGWGSLSLWMAEHYPNARITAVSNSNSQRQYILGEAIKRGVARNLRVLTADMNDFRPDGEFDRVVSVEMFEHMRNHHELLRRISRWLRPDGKLFVHVFCHREFPYTFETEGASNWMGRYFFSGGVMPSENLLPHYGQHLSVERQWRWSGDHYQKTADAWLGKLHQNRAEVDAIFELAYGAREADRWRNRWRMFFLAVSELFGFHEGREWFVAHYLFRHASQGAAASAPRAEQRSPVAQS